MTEDHVHHLNAEDTVQSTFYASMKMISKDQQKICMTNKLFLSVWDAIEETPGDSACMEFRSRLMISIKAHLTHHHINTSTASKLCRASEDQMSDLISGKMSAFSLDVLVRVAINLGMKVDLHVIDSHA
jgi:predicted XRE-type DNA-binding protein